MSYILDALRKADAQREGDAARGIHAQPLHVPGLEREQPGPHRLWFWAVAVLAIAAVATLGWYRYQDQAPVAMAFAHMQSSTHAVPISPEPATAASKPAPAAVPASMAAAPHLDAARTVSVAPSATAVATAILPPAAAPSEQPMSATGTLQQSQSDIKNNARPALRGGSRPAAGDAAASGVPAASGGPAVMTAPEPGAGASAAATVVAGLPPDAPKLTIGGGVYSSNKAQRMLIVNGQVFGEGADLGSGLVLDEIRAKSALFRFRGSRYLVGY